MRQEITPFGETPLGVLTTWMSSDSVGKPHRARFPHSEYGS